jgi:hypothetical protein
LDELSLRPEDNGLIEGDNEKADENDVSANSIILVDPLLFKYAGVLHVQVSVILGALFSSCFEQGFLNCMSPHVQANIIFDGHYLTGFVVVRVIFLEVEVLIAVRF